MQHVNLGPADYAIVTSYPRAWEETLAPITDKMKHEYAQQHGYHFFADCSDLYGPRGARVNGAPNEAVPLLGFVKLDMLCDWLPRYKGVVWMDADMLITNPKVPLEGFFDRMSRHDVGVSYDHNGFHSTVIFARNTEKAMDYLWAANHIGRNFYAGDPWHEMTALRHFWQDPPYNEGFMHFFSAKETCPIYKPAYVKIGLPEHIGKAYAWEPGDWTCHLSAHSLEDRVKMAQQWERRKRFDGI